MNCTKIPNREKVDELIKLIIKNASNGGYLDHTIRAVEEYIIKKRGTKLYRISKGITLNSKYNHGQGFVYIFMNGATLKYSPKGNGIDKRFAIAHELGHIMLHFEPYTSWHNDLNINSATSISIIDPKRETQASYFAKEVVNAREDLMDRKEIMPLNDDAVKRYCLSYNPKLIEDEADT